MQSTRTSELFMSVKSRYLNFIGQTRPQAEQDERSSDIVLHAITETQYNPIDKTLQIKLVRNNQSSTEEERRRKAQL